MDALEELRRRLRVLEGDPDMRKGRLIEQILADHTIHWDAIYGVLRWKGRHRHKLRWRRTLITEALNRAFPRGGRRSAVAQSPVHESRSTPVTLTAARRPSPSPGGEGEGTEDLVAIAPADVWRRFHAAYPILALYRSVWNPRSPIARGEPVGSPLAERYEALWRTAGEGGVALPTARIAEALDWPAAVAPSLHLVVLLAARLWPTHPWERWAEEDAATGDTAIRRAAVPFVRRSACLVHGFSLGGCDPRGVWEAIELPRRSKPTAAAPTVHGEQKKNIHAP